MSSTLNLIDNPVTFNFFSISMPITIVATYLFFYGISVINTLLIIVSKHGFVGSSKKITVSLANEPLKKFCFAITSISLLGVPPTWGFLLKLSAMTTLLANGNIINFLILFIFSLVGLYLYIQILKYSLPSSVANKSLKTYLLTKRTSSFLVYYSMIFFSFLMFFSILFLRDFFLIFLS